MTLKVLTLAIIAAVVRCSTCDVNTTTTLTQGLADVPVITAYPRLIYVMDDGECSAVFHYDDREAPFGCGRLIGIVPTPPEVLQVSATGLKPVLISFANDLSSATVERQPDEDGDCTGDVEVEITTGCLPLMERETRFQL